MACANVSSKVGFSDILTRTSFRFKRSDYLRYFYFHIQMLIEDFLNFIAPSKAPENVTVQSFMAHDTMRITWKQIESQYVHGDLKGYKIISKLLKIGGQSKVTAKSRVKMIHPSMVETTLTGLEANSKYSIVILAYNEYGDGITSSEIVGGMLNTQTMTIFVRFAFRVISSISHER